jgi:Trk K+ transport system NAD-binding subunit
MKVIICGAGQVGWQIARHLSGENNDVTVVDSNPDLVRRATDTLDVQGLCGFASYPDILERAGARDADMIIAATHSDEVNMVTCQVAHSVFAISRKIARLRSQSYLDAIYSDLYRRDHMPIDVVISPEKEVAEAALQRLAAPAAFDTETFLTGRAKLLGLRLEEDCPVVNTPLRQLSDLFSTLRVVVLAVRRDGRLFAPEAADQLFVGDECYVFAPNEDIPRTLEVFGKESHKQERVVILGGGNVGLAVAKALEARGRGIRAKVVERDRRIAERAADALEEARTARSYSTIRAPFDARLVDRFVDPGDTVMPGTPMARLYDPGRLRLEANVRESLAELLRSLDQLDVRIDALDRTVRGRIEEIVPSSDPGSRTFVVKVGLPADPALFPGMFGRLAIPVGVEERFLVPGDAVLRVGQLEFVRVESGEGVQRRHVRTGQPAEDGLIEVRSGLEPGERVRVPAGA